MDFFSDIAKALQEQNFVPSINLILGAKYFLMQKSVVITKISVYWWAKGLFFVRKCWNMLIYIILHQKSGSPQDLRYEPRCQYL